MSRPSPAAEGRTHTSTLHQVVSLSEQMIALADEGEQLADTFDARVLLFTLRDCGYRLRQMALRQFGPRRADPVMRSDLPQPNAPRPEVVAPRRAHRKAALGKRVLVVDDDPDTVTYLQAWFQDRGFDPVAANDGAEALERAASLRPDLITLDVSMPDASGATTYQALRNDSILCHVPVIVITAVSGAKRSFTQDVRRGQLTGFLAKPIDLTELGRLVKRLT